MSDLATIKELRAQTGAGMVDCQEALKEANDDINQAIEILRKKGLQKAAKKADRQTREGVIALAGDQTKMAVVGVACETDFVARNADFMTAVQGYANELLVAAEVESFKTELTERLKNDLVAKIGENIQLAQAEIVSGQLVGSYLHSNRKIAGLVVLSGGNQTVANDIAMQIAAQSPLYLNPSDVPTEVLAKEKEIYLEQMADQNKPADVLEKIIAGKIEKYYAEVCLTKQQYIKDDSQTIEQYLASVDPAAKILSFARYAI